jgi:hypothetical protein
MGEAQGRSNEAGASAWLAGCDLASLRPPPTLSPFPLFAAAFVEWRVHFGHGKPLKESGERILRQLMALKTFRPFLESGDLADPRETP